MTDKELRRLKRPQLLQMMLQQTKRAEKLSEENARLKERIADRERSLAQTGALAEAALQLSGTSDREAAVNNLELIRGLADEVAGQIAEEDGGEDAGEDEEPPEQDRPTVEQLERAVLKTRYRKRYVWTLRSTVYALVVVAAMAVLLAVLVMPVLQIYGSSMNPTLWEGEYVVSVKNSGMDTGDIIAFYYNNRILVKRVIGQAGQWIDIAEDGTVYVDNVKIDEPYLTDIAFGECDIELPYQVPESRIFVMGDNRSVSVDSRSTTVGCVAEEQLVGKIVFRIWPLSGFGPIK